MNPSEANVFSSGFSGILSSKNRKDVSYSRLNQMDDDSVEFSKVQFQKDHTSLCAKICFSLLALMLLFATVATAILIMNLKHFTVEVQLEKGKVQVYRFDQELVAITGNEDTTRNMSFVVSMHVINRTESECWFGIVLSFPKDAKNILLYSKDFAFLTRVTNTELGDFQDGPQSHFKVFGNRKTNHELSFYVHNVLHQLLPIIKVKLYEFVLSKVSSSSRKTVVEKHGFLPGRVHVKRTMITKRDVVTVTAQSNPHDFENFFSNENGKSTEGASWKLTYDETTIVNKKTGMVKRSDLSLSCKLPIGDEFTAEPRNHHQGLDVRFRSVVKLLDKSDVKVKTWKNVLREGKDINHILDPPNAKESSVVYFAPPKHKSSKGLAEELKELIKLGKTSAGRSTKLPPMIKISHRNIPKSVNDDEMDEESNDDEDYMPINEDSDDDDDENNDNDDESDNDDDSNGPYWPQPNYAPFGMGYEVKRRRSVEKRKPQLTKKRKTGKNSRLERKTPKLDVIWDEITSSAPMPLHEPPRLVQATILGLDFRAEIDYQVQANDEDYDNDDDEDWSVTTGYRVTFGWYRIAPFKRVHSLNKLRDKLPGKGQRKISRSTVHAGDFVLCIPLFYIQRLCAAMRLTFDVTVTYSLPRLSLSYPVELTVHIGQTVTTNATLSGHVSTWFHEAGFYTKGTVAMAVLPVRLSFKEDTTPEWCIKGNLEQKEVRINTVPLSSWNCSLDYTNLPNTCNGLPASNSTSMTFDLQYSSTEGTMFDNWHYPISCAHRRDFTSYR